MGSSVLKKSTFEADAEHSKIKIRKD